jgi:hypothetical protein
VRADVFTLDAGSGSGVINRVGFDTTSSGASYAVCIYGSVSGAAFSGLLMQESGVCAEAGYHSVSLASPVMIEHDQRIAVVVGLTTLGYTYPLAYEYPDGGGTRRPRMLLRGRATTAPTAPRGAT